MVVGIIIAVIVVLIVLWAVSAYTGWSRYVIV